MRRVKLITEQEYLASNTEQAGFCSNCQEFTQNGVEPDAQNYNCEECGESTVMGTEQALVMGLIDIGENI